MFSTAPFMQLSDNPVIIVRLGFWIAACNQSHRPNAVDEHPVHVCGNSDKFRACANTHLICVAYHYPHFRNGHITLMLMMCVHAHHG
jgi:hypothetical protein